MDWLAAVAELRERREAGVLVTLASVRGHAPREAGAKMLVGATRTWDTVGGGNLEATAVAQARRMLAEGRTAPELISIRLTERAPVEYGVQCCGGDISLLLEPMKTVPSVAIFGVGHVGFELALILCRHDLELTLVDSRDEEMADERLAPLYTGIARVHAEHVPVPESVLPTLPAGTHVLILTHDHMEDLALCESALRHDQLASIGLIGSSAKWSRFTKHLKEAGYTSEEMARITTPIGIPGIASKQPAAIAVSVAADLLMRFTGPADAEAGPRKSVSRRRAAAAAR